MHIRTETADGYTRKNNCNVRQLYPWTDVVIPPWNSTLVTVDPGESTTRHQHATDETFIFIEGAGQVWIGDERRAVVPGDVIYIPHGTEHTITNQSATEQLRLVSIYWLQPTESAPAQVV